MHIKYEHVQAVDDKFIFQTSRKCCKNFNQREISHRQYEVKLWFFHTALCQFNSYGYIMAVGDAQVFPGFLVPVLTQLFFPKPLTTFLTCFCRSFKSIRLEMTKLRSRLRTILKNLLIQGQIIPVVPV